MSDIDDDDTTTGGKLSYWLKYKLYHSKVQGWMVVVAVFIAGLIVGKVYL